MDDLANPGVVRAQSTHSIAYIPALDGLRGIAVTLVFLQHLGVIRAGLFGVDIFFVLSGYLITETLATSPRNNAFLPRFYLRRFLRLFPALAIVCVTITVVAYVVGGAFSADIYADVLSSILYTQSWTSAFKDGFSSYLGQTWSLSVEEQFYLLWPVTWLLMTNGRNARTAIIASLALLGLSLAYGAYMSGTHRISFSRLYFSPDFRFQGILLGAVGSIAGRTTGFPQAAVRLLASVPLIPLVGILLASAYWSWSFFSEITVSLLSLMTILRLAAGLNTIDGRALSVWPIVGLGRISYGFYLWHVPILLVLERNFKFDFWRVALVGLPASLLASAVSYVVVERPALRLRYVLRPATQSVIGVCALLLSLVSIIGGLAYFQWDEIDNVLHPVALAVLQYGPSSYQIGNKAALQPDGTLTMWAIFNRRPDLRSSAQIAGQKARISMARDDMWMKVPRSVISTPGHYTMQIYDSQLQPEGPPLPIDILPATPLN